MDSAIFLMPREKFDPAILGLATRAGFDEPVICYDIQMLINILVSEGMQPEDAVDFFNFNILNAWYGDGTPVFMDVQSVQEINDQILDDQSVH